MSKTGSEALQRAKRALKKKYQDCGWFRGVGIVPTADGLALRLNVDPDEPLEETIPDTYYTFPIEIVKIGGYRDRNSNIAPR